MSAGAVLVTAVGGDIGCAIARGLFEDGFAVVGCDRRDWPVLDDILCARYVVPPASRESAYLSTLEDIVAKEDVAFLLPVSEPEIIALDRNRSRFEGNKIKVVLNSPDVIATCMDKLLTVSFLEQAGVRVPRTFSLEDYRSELQMPVVLKRRSGCGSKGVRIINDEAEIQMLRGLQEPGWLVQELVGTPEEEYTTGVFSDGDRIESISFKRRLGFGSMTVEAERVDDRRLDDMARRIAASFKLRGSINIQSRLAGNGFLPFEINPRISSSAIFRRHFGFNDLVWWLNSLDGKPFVPPRAYGDGRAWRTLGEHYVDGSA